MSGYSPVGVGAHGFGLVAINEDEDEVIMHFTSQSGAPRLGLATTDQWDG